MSSSKLFKLFTFNVGDDPHFGQHLLFHPKGEILNTPDFRFGQNDNFKSDSIKIYFPIPSSMKIHFQTLNVHRFTRTMRLANVTWWKGRNLRAVAPSGLDRKGLVSSGRLEQN
tara:strand:- start:338 stop:676 length:339 start_codon:yes stop_codon:yes gene_type:complete